MDLVDLAPVDDALNVPDTHGSAGVNVCCCAYVEDSLDIVVFDVSEGWMDCRCRGKKSVCVPRALRTARTYLAPSLCVPYVTLRCPLRATSRWAAHLVQTNLESAY